MEDIGWAERCCIVADPSKAAKITMRWDTRNLIRVESQHTKQRYHRVNQVGKHAPDCNKNDYPKLTSI